MSKHNLKIILKNILCYYNWYHTLPNDPQLSYALKEVDKNGFCVIEDFYSKEKCEEFIFEIDNLLLKYKTNIWTDPKESDLRIFGANRVSNIINEYYENPFINRFLHAYENSNTKNGFTMSGKLTFKEDNLGSGQGWHRDRADFKQTKSILYLNNVDEDGGPFQYILKSHKPYNYFKDSIRYKFKLNQYRFDDTEINQLIEKEPDRFITVKGKAGTLILADVHGIHRGKPIQNGNRYTLTNYNWFNGEVPRHISSITIK